MSKQNLSNHISIYRKKPIEIQAIQLSNVNIQDVAIWCGGKVIEEESPWYQDCEDYYRAILIPTLEGAMRAELGSYVIKGVQGEFYACKDTIFDETYERVS